MRAVQWRARPNAAHSLHRRRRPGDALIADRVQHLAAEIAFVRIVSVDDGEITPARAVRAHAEQREILDHLAPHRGGVGVTLALGQPSGPRLTALVTRAARDELGLAPGAAVTVLLKASALRTPH